MLDLRYLRDIQNCLNEFVFNEYIDSLKQAKNNLKIKMVIL